MLVNKISNQSRLWVKRKIIIFVIDNKEFRTVQQSNVQHDMCELFKCLCFMEMLSTKTTMQVLWILDVSWFTIASNFMVLLLTTQGSQVLKTGKSDISPPHPDHAP